MIMYPAFAQMLINGDGSTFMSRVSTESLQYPLLLQPFSRFYARGGQVAQTFSHGFIRIVKDVHADITGKGGHNVPLGDLMMAHKLSSLSHKLVCPADAQSGNVP